MNFHKKMKGKEGSVRHTGQTYPNREYGKETLRGGGACIWPEDAEALFVDQF